MSKKAVLVGINYIGTKNQLSGCINDVKNMRSFLVNHCGYNADDTRLLTEEQNSIWPSKQNIETQLRWLVANTKAGDTLVFYFSGHGSNIPDRSGDERDGLDEVLCPVDYEKAGIISDDWLYTNVARLVPRDATLYSFTDCCNSGSMMDLKCNYISLCALRRGNIRKGMPYVTGEWSDRFSFSLENNLPDITGNVVLFSGCGDPETSADTVFNGLSQGAFSYCLQECLKSNLERVPGTQTQRFKRNNLKLLSILKEVKCRLDIHGFKQTAQMSASSMRMGERTLDL
jgi:hypothetical protein